MCALCCLPAIPPESAPSASAHYCPLTWEPPRQPRTARSPTWRPASIFFDFADVNMEAHDTTSCREPVDMSLWITLQKGHCAARRRTASTIYYDVFRILVEREASFRVAPRSAWHWAAGASGSLDRLSYRRILSLEVQCFDNKSQRITFSCTCSVGACSHIFQT